VIEYKERGNPVDVLVDERARKLESLCELLNLVAQVNMTILVFIYTDLNAPLLHTASHSTSSV
jgi:hypothetical protein